MKASHRAFRIIIQNTLSGSWKARFNRKSSEIPSKTGISASEKSEHSGQTPVVHVHTSAHRPEVDWSGQDIPAYANTDEKVSTSLIPLPNA